MTGPLGADTVARQMAWEALQAVQAVQAAQVVVPSTCRLGSARTGLLLAVGGSVDLPIAWSAPMPSDGYVVEPVAGPGVLGAATLAVKSQSAAGCVVTVTALLAVAAGAVVFAHARN